MAVATPISRLVAPGPTDPVQTPTLPETARVAVGDVRGGLLVADQMEPDSRFVQEGVQDVGVAVAGVAEDVFDPVRGQASHE